MTHSIETRARWRRCSKGASPPVSNGCAISKAQYAEFGARFQTLDGLARQIDSLVAKGSLDEQGKQGLADLVSRYGELTAGLGGA